MIKVKICGITNLEDALAAVRCGADALGFVFADSPRRIEPHLVSQIVAQLPPFVTKVGVFVDGELDIVREIMLKCSLDLAQLHGSESPAFCQALFPRVVKSFRVRDESVLELMPHYHVSAYLLDSYHPTQKGGTGRGFDWGIAQRAKQYGHLILSGGLTVENVSSAVREVQPYAVDVSSGVESSPGKKDHRKIRTFIEAAKRT